MSIAKKIISGEIFEQKKNCQWNEIESFDCDSSSGAIVFLPSLLKKKPHTFTPAMRIHWDSDHSVCPVQAGYQFMICMPHRMTAQPDSNKNLDIAN